jgi:hypothetical protein
MRIEYINIKRGTVILLSSFLWAYKFTGRCYTVPKTDLDIIGLTNYGCSPFENHMSKTTPEETPCPQDPYLPTPLFTSTPVNTNLPRSSYIGSMVGRK